MFYMCLVCFVSPERSSCPDLISLLSSDGVKLNKLCTWLGCRSFSLKNTRNVLFDLIVVKSSHDHSILLQRRERVIGIKGTASGWFNSYLSDTDVLSLPQCFSVAAADLWIFFPFSSALSQFLLVSPRCHLLLSYFFLIALLDTPVCLRVWGDCRRFSLCPLGGLCRDQLGLLYWF